MLFTDAYWVWISPKNGQNELRLDVITGRENPTIFRNVCRQMSHIFHQAVNNVIETTLIRHVNYYSDYGLLKDLICYEILR